MLKGSGCRRRGGSQPPQHRTWGPGGRPVHPEGSRGLAGCGSWKAGAAARRQWAAADLGELGVTELAPTSHVALGSSAHSPGLSDCICEMERGRGNGALERLGSFLLRRPRILHALDGVGRGARHPLPNSFDIGCPTGRNSGVDAHWWELLLCENGEFSVYTCRVYSPRTSVKPGPLHALKLRQSPGEPRPPCGVRVSARPPGGPAVRVPRGWARCSGLGCQEPMSPSRCRFF